MRFVLLAPVLLLAACGGGHEAGNNSSDQDAGATTEPVPENAMTDPTNTVVPLPPRASPTPAALTAFPAAFQGRWSLGEADCDPAQADAAKGLMVVEPARVVFFESRGTIARIEQTTPSRLVAELRYSGEGQQWTRRSTLTLLDGGKTLTTETPDDPEPPMRSLRYARCPA